MKSTDGMLGTWRDKRQISTASCSGQPRTINFIDGKPYEWIDVWYDEPNETNAAVRQEPIELDGGGSIRPLGC